jgi:hypothetical protein
MTSLSVKDALNDPDARWLTVAEAARQIVRSEAQVRRMLEVGELTGARVLGRVAVLEASVRVHRPSEMPK